MKTTKTTELFAQVLQQLHAAELALTDAMCEHFIDEGSEPEPAMDLAGDWVMKHFAPQFKQVVAIVKNEMAECIDTHALNCVCGSKQEFAL